MVDALDRVCALTPESSCSFRTLARTALLGVTGRGRDERFCSNAYEDEEWNVRYEYLDIVLSTKSLNLCPDG